MGKFKQLHAELQEQLEKKQLLSMEQCRKREIADMLCMQYPTLYHFIQQAFDMGDEDKVFDLIFSLETEHPPC